MGIPEAGHRTLPHTADLIIEAWAPSREDCLEQAVLALVGAFAAISPVVSTETLPISIPPANDEELLVSLLEEVLYLVEVLQVVPVSVTVLESEDGGLGGCFDVAPISALSRQGPLPKAIARSDLAIGRDRDLWRCRALVDV
jgi:SHS2 domain-containing protein